MWARLLSLAGVFLMSNPPSTPSTDTPPRSDWLDLEEPLLKIAERVEAWYDGKDGNLHETATQFAVDIGALLSTVTERDATIARLADEINNLRYPVPELDAPTDTPELEKLLDELEMAAVGYMEDSRTRKTRVIPARRAITDLVASLRAEVEGHKTDAQRWQALIQCPRVEILGGARYHKPGWLLAVQFHTEAPSGIATEESRDLLRQFADWRISGYSSGGEK
jgi:hypothetical protein